MDKTAWLGANRANWDERVGVHLGVCDLAPLRSGRGRYAALAGGGLRLFWLREHDSVPWRMFDCLVRNGDGMYRWPKEAWLPLAFSLYAELPPM